MAFSLSACQKPGAGPEPEPSASNAPAPTPTPTPDPEEAVRTYWSEDQLTQAWGPNQVVEHLFFHPVIAYPEFTFSSAVPENRQKGLDDWMMADDEFRYLDELDRRTTSWSTCAMCGASTPPRAASPGCSATPHAARGQEAPGPLL